MKIKYIAVFLILLCCFVGAVSATEDVSADGAVAASDDVAVDEVVSEVDTSDEMAAKNVDENVDENVGSVDADVLGDWEYHDVIYINSSSPNDPEEMDGSDWANAYGQDWCLEQAVTYINDGGTIYAAEGVYALNIGNGVNYKIIGMNKEKTFMSADFLNHMVSKDFDSDRISFPSNAYAHDIHCVATFINITFITPLNPFKLTNEKVFINCTFINVPISTNEEVYSQYTINPGDFVIYGISSSFVVNFTNCEFVNYTKNVLTSYTTSKVNFNDCIFDNVTADSIAGHTGDFVLEDSINFYRCNFNNVSVKGIVEVPTGAKVGDNYNIEYCNGVDDLGVVSNGTHEFINCTKSKSQTTVVSNVDKNGNLLINLTSADGTDMVNETVLISINGGEFTPCTLGDNGILSIPVTSLTNLTGKVNIVVVYDDNDFFIGNSTETEYVIPVPTTPSQSATTTTKKVTPLKTKITAKKATFKAKKKTKKYTITLKAGKKAVAKVKVTLKVGKKTYTAKTNKKGKATFNLKKLTKKGKYNAVIKFKGNKNFKSATKKVKITVKK